MIHLNYNRTEWINGVTDLSAENFNKIENAIYELGQILNVNQDTVSTLEENVETTNQKVSENTNNIRNISTDVQTLSTDIQGIGSKVQTIDTNVKTVDTNVKTINTNVQTINTKTQNIETKVQTIEPKIQTIDTNVKTIDTNVKTISTKVQGVDTKVQAVDTKVQTVSSNITTNHNEVLGQLEDIKNKLDSLNVGGGTGSQPSTSSMIKGYVKQVDDITIQSDAIIVTTNDEFKNALRQVKQGGTVLVRAGNYDIGSQWLTLQGTKEKPVIIKNYPNEEVIINNPKITFEGKCSYVTFSGFKMTGSVDAWGCVLQFRGCATNVTLSNLEIYGVKHKIAEGEDSGGCNLLLLLGISSNPCTDFIIDNCYIHDCDTGWCEAITINGNVDGAIVRNCTIHDTKNIGIDVAGNFSWVVDEVPADEQASFINQARNCKVYNNLVMNCLSPYATSAGIYADGSSYNEFYDNFVYNCQCGIEFGAEESGREIVGNKAYRNYISGCGRGIGVGGYQSTSAKHSNSLIENNIIICKAGFKENTAFLIERTSDVTVKDNIIVLDKGTTMYNNPNKVSVTEINNMKLQIGI